MSKIGAETALANRAKNTRTEEEYKSVIKVSTLIILGLVLFDLVAVAGLLYIVYPFKIF